MEARVARQHVLSAYQPRQLNKSIKEGVGLHPRPNASLGNQGSSWQKTETAQAWDGAGHDPGAEQLFLSQRETKRDVETGRGKPKASQPTE